MLTKKIENLKEQYRKLLGEENPSRLQQTVLSNAIFDELVAHCQPTRAEFRRVMSYVVVTPGMLYEIMTKAGFWEEE